MMCVFESASQSYYGEWTFIRTFEIRYMPCTVVYSSRTLVLCCTVLYSSLTVVLWCIAAAQESEVSGHLPELLKSDICRNIVHRESEISGHLSELLKLDICRYLSKNLMFLILIIDISYGIMWFIIEILYLRNERWVDIYQNFWNQIYADIYQRTSCF